MTLVISWLFYSTTEELGDVMLFIKTYCLLKLDFKTGLLECVNNFFQVGVWVYV